MYSHAFPSRNLLYPLLEHAKHHIFAGQLRPRCKIELMSDVDTNPQKPEEYRAPLPPASFTMFVLSLRAQCEMQLGMMSFGEDEEPAPDLAIARHTIDLMVILLEKTKGNLTLEEQRLLENSVTELRFRFVQVADEVSKAASQKA